jgi:hypothetical protein
MNVLVRSTVLTVLVSVFLTMFMSVLGDIKLSRPGGVGSTTDLPDSTNASPFRNTLAMIRWNSARMERVPSIRKYAPFFHTIHISIPNMLKEQPNTFHNQTHDQFGDAFLIC